MQAVILAAGKGRRLSAASKGLPKALVTVGDRPLIEHQLESLADAGIGQVLMVVGHKSDEIRKVVGNRASYLENKKYKETNSLYSLWLARDWITGPFVLMNCDLLYHPEILHRLLARGGNALAYDSSSSGGQEQTKVALREGNVIDLGKDVPYELSRGESLGLVCFDDLGRKALFKSAKALIRNGGKQSWALEAIRVTCGKIQFRGVNVAGLPWAEIDFPYDLIRAQTEVWPIIRRSRWQGTVRWRRTRWVAAALLAILMAGAGWVINSSVQTQEMEWTSVVPSHGGELVLRLPKGDQRWWMAIREEPLTTIVRGPSDVRVELRLFQSPHRPMPGRYVVQVGLDGSPLTWETFNVTPDSEAVYMGRCLGDRDRLTLAIPAGEHTIDVGLLAGTGDTLLARVRVPEPVTPEEDGEE